MLGDGFIYPGVEMPVTRAMSVVALTNPNCLGQDMAKKMEPTKPVRVHIAVAELAEKLAPIFGKSVPDFVSDLLRPILNDMRQEAAARLLDEKPPHKKK